MSPRRKDNQAPALIQEWALPAGATLGSSVRARGILLEIRARLPSKMKKHLDIKGAALILSLPEGADDDFRSVSRIVSGALTGIESLPVIPREIEDILSISTTERHRWLKDGRLPSAGTRTVKLRGRAKKITFHVFDPLKVEDVLDQDLVAEWREDDAITAAENRRRAAWNAKLTRSKKGGGEPKAKADTSIVASSVELIDWEEFERDGPLR